MNSENSPVAVMTASLNNLLNEIQSVVKRPRYEILVKPHVNYLYHYIKSLAEEHKGRELLEDEMTVVVERYYVDSDYIDDYSHFHVRSFFEYGRLCVRLHFFANDIQERQFLSWLADPANPGFSAALKDYLGFVVIRPLPKTFVGRTCLLPPKRASLEVPFGQTYTLSLFGMTAKTGDTIAFQEQDNVVSICATNALWFTFHAQGLNAGNPLFPSPAMITKKASELTEVAERIFPAVGLTPNMLAATIKSQNLEPQISNLNINNDTRLTADLLKRESYAYMRDGVAAPILSISLGADIDKLEVFIFLSIQPEPSRGWL